MKREKRENYAKEDGDWTPNSSPRPGIEPGSPP
eukprot:COSAG01_NODE_496_length_16290_cov_48.639244_10_plen_33_part_00